jgi:hypothetical protein
LAVESAALFSNFALDALVFLGTFAIDVKTGPSRAAFLSPAEQRHCQN